jgi:purine-binding chemotaxis protein CheW
MDRPLPPSSLTTPAERTLVICRVGDQACALYAEEVTEVLAAVRLTPLPAAPPAVEGLFNMRGRLVPVLDIRRRFGQSLSPIAVSDRFVVVRVGPRNLALRVDAVDDIRRIPATAIDDAAAVVPEARSVRGVARMADGLCLIYDLETFLTHAEFVALDAAIAAGPSS